jgi:hypothetical protein
MRGYPYRPGSLADNPRHGVSVQASHDPQHDDLRLVRWQRRD